MRVEYNDGAGFNRVLLEWMRVEMSIHKASDSIAWLQVEDMWQKSYSLLGYPDLEKLKEKFNHLY